MSDVGRENEIEADVLERGCRPHQVDGDRSDLSQSNTTREAQLLIILWKQMA